MTERNIVNFHSKLVPIRVIRGLFLIPNPLPSVPSVNSVVNLFVPFCASCAFAPLVPLFSGDHVAFTGSVVVKMPYSSVSAFLAFFRGYFLFPNSSPLRAHPCSSVSIRGFFPQRPDHNHDYD